MIDQALLKKIDAMAGRYMPPERKLTADDYTLPNGGDDLPDGVILVNGASLTPEPISWLWQYWLARGKVQVLAGPPGQGKTTIAMACAA